MWCLRGQRRHPEGWSVGNEDMGVEHRKQDWEKGMEPGLPHTDVGQGMKSPGGRILEKRRMLGGVRRQGAIH